MIIVYFFRGLADILFWLGLSAIGLGVTAGLLRSLWIMNSKPIDDSEFRRPKTMSKAPESGG